MEAYEQINKAINDFPPIPNIALKFLDKIRSKGGTSESLSKAAELDHIFAARILKVSNSAYYGQNQEIKSIPQAVSTLGQDILSNIIYVSSLSSYFVKGIKSYQLKRGELWKHSLSTAFAARLLCSKLKFQNKEKAFTAGLLHDIGKIIMDSLVEDKKEQVAEWAEEGCPDFLEFEKNTFGIHHQTAGAKIVQAWNFPEDIVDAVQNHHTPDNCKVDFSLTASIHLADFICCMIGIGGGIKAIAYNPIFSILEKVNFNFADLELLEDEIFNELANVEDFLNI